MIYFISTDYLEGNAPLRRFEVGVLNNDNSPVIDEEGYALYVEIEAVDSSDAIYRFRKLYPDFRSGMVI